MRLPPTHLVAALLLLAPGASLLADTSGPPDLPKHPWMSFRAGSSVTFKRTTVRNGATTEMNMTITLLEVTKTGYKLEYAYDNAGGRRNVTEHAADEDSYKQFEKGASGKETVTVGGKHYACTWTEYTYKPDPKMNYKMKVWRCPTVIGGTVKSETTLDTGGGMKFTTELVESKRK